MRPESDFERVGFVPDVVFPTGIVDSGDELLVYYGAADSVTAVVAIEREALIDKIILNTIFPLPPR